MIIAVGYRVKWIWARSVLHLLRWTLEKLRALKRRRLGRRQGKARGSDGDWPCRGGEVEKVTQRSEIICG